MRRSDTLDAVELRITTDRVALKKGAASLVLPLHPPVSDEEE